MAVANQKNKQNISLLSSPTRVEVPFIKVQIGTYVFGVYNKETVNKYDDQNFYQAQKIVYPNYIKSLQIRKINGQVNQYTLVLDYPITQNDDPNFFEKVFSSVSRSRKIIFSYGDMALPTYIYKNEEAIITKVTTNFNVGNSFNSIIQYTVQAVSSASLGTNASFAFINQGLKQPSEEIWRVLKNPNYGLLDLFTGMRNESVVRELGLIPGGDKKVELESFSAITPLEYINYLVSCMIPADSPWKNKSNGIFLLVIRDDTSSDNISPGDNLGGPYFKIVRNDHNVEQSDAYELNIGYPSGNVVTSFNIQNNENYSILYDFNTDLNTEEYVRRINDDGKWEDVYAPSITSQNKEHKTRSSDITYWTRMTEYPIKATVTIKGLLRPAILMTHVRINVIFPGGKKHISSGLYVVTEQIDSIGLQGYSTTLGLVRVGKDLGEDTFTAGA